VAVPPPEAPPAPAVAPAPAPAPVVKAPEFSISIPARLQALEQGDLDLAVRQGQRLAKEIPPGHWTLRLEIACQGDTIRRLVEIFKGKEPDIFLMPISLLDGRVCYQVLYGRFATQAAAEKQLKRLPPSFLAGRNRPRAFRFFEIPKVQ
jgi:septal ring-binding cell division protein DamX